MPGFYLKPKFYFLQVYKKVWLAENNESDAMRVVYRMRGLLGDATEEFVETLDKKKEENVDNEQVYRMAGVMSHCGGLEVSLCHVKVTSSLHTIPYIQYSTGTHVIVILK